MCWEQSGSRTWEQPLHCGQETRAQAWLGHDTPRDTGPSGDFIPSEPVPLYAKQGAALPGHCTGMASEQMTQDIY